ncbi:ATP-dependent translocase ABCB1 [Lamellibrachia satsuma]|nr:ATP-dependent translocase ABCB1 [Lamellibrachia satsuma]
MTEFNNTFNCRARLVPVPHGPVFPEIVADDIDDTITNKEPTCRLLSTEDDDNKQAVDTEEDLPEASMLRILKFNSPEWPYIAGGLLTALIVGGQNPCFAIIFSEFLDVFRLTDLDEQKRLSNLYSLMFLVIAIVTGTAMFFQIFLFSVSAECLTLRLRQIVFKRPAASGRIICLFSYLLAFCLHLYLPVHPRDCPLILLSVQEIGYFDDHRRATGALTTRLSTDASAVHGASGVKLAATLQGGVSIIAGVLIGFIYSWELTLVILAFAPFLVISGTLQIKMMAGNMGMSQGALEEAGKIATESMENIRTVASLSKEAHFVKEYKKLTDVPYKQSLKKAHLIGIAFSFSQALVYIVHAVAFYFGAWLVEHRGLQFVDVFKVFGAIVFGAMGMGQGNSFIPDYAKAKAAAARIFNIIDREPEIDAFSTDGLKPQSAEGAVELQEVQFRYPSRPTVTVLKNMSIVIEPGKTVALVGSSGCGKSTIVQLLERFYDPTHGSLYFPVILLQPYSRLPCEYFPVFSFYDPTHGSLLIDGHRLGEYNIAWLRAQIGLVSQEPVLFNCSIAENIAYGDNSREVPMHEITEAARQANIHNFIVALPQANIDNFTVSLPQGYETNVGDKGVQMSGGQKQRIAIARALVRNPKILLLDEATSALDTESEKLVQDALDRAQQGRTSIVIAHRLSTIQNADCIFVIKNGRIVEMGTHSQLVAKRGVYFELNSSAI